MLTSLADKKIYMASKPVDFRMSIDGLSQMVTKNKMTWLHDGSVYVFYNRHKDKIKCLFWDRNGFVLYYKRLDNTKFKFAEMTEELASVSPEDLEIILSGFDPSKVERQNLLTHEAS